MHSEQAWLRGYVRVWHEADVRPLAGLGLLTGALPTFGVQCPLRADSERPL